MYHLYKYILTISSFIAIFCVILIQKTYAQDIHFSQISSSPLNLNPGETGAFQGNYRFTANHRNQWFTVANPFVTFSAGIDGKLFDQKKKKFIIAGGLIFNTDIAGKSEYTELEAMGSLSFIKALNYKKTHFLSVGLQGGVGQNSFDYAKLKFDDQFNGKQYDPFVPSIESFDNQILYPDLSIGLYWMFQPQKYEIYSAGFSLSHINRPSLSFFENHEVFLNRKFTGYFRALFEISEKTQMQPAIYYLQQHNYRELLIGSNFRFIQNFSKKNFSAINAGIFYRGRDALILSLGWDWKSLGFGFSYDVNISSLRSASKTVGAYELSILYIISNNKKPKPAKIPCHIF